MYLLILVARCSAPSSGLPGLGWLGNAGRGPSAVPTTISSVPEGTGTNLSLPASSLHGQGSDGFVTGKPPSDRVRSGRGRRRWISDKGFNLLFRDKKVQPEMNQQLNLTVQGSSHRATTTFQLGLCRRPDH